MILNHTDHDNALLRQHLLMGEKLAEAEAEYRRHQASAIIECPAEHAKSEDKRKAWADKMAGPQRLERDIAAVRYESAQYALKLQIARAEASR